MLRIKLDGLLEGKSWIYKDYFRRGSTVAGIESKLTTYKTSVLSAVLSIQLAPKHDILLGKKAVKSNCIIKWLTWSYSETSILCSYYISRHRRRICKNINVLYSVFWPHLTMFWGYSWSWTQGLFLVGIGLHTGFWGLNPSQLHECCICWTVTGRTCNQSF